MILARVVLMIVCDSACCEVGFSALNRTQTQSRSNLKVSTIREVLTTHFLGDPIKEFKPGPIYEKWIDLPFDKGNNNSRGRELQSMMRRVVKSISARGEGESPTAKKGFSDCAELSARGPIARSSRARAIWGLGCLIWMRVMNRGLFPFTSFPCCLLIVDRNGYRYGISYI